MAHLNTIRSSIRDGSHKVLQLNTFFKTVSDKNKFFKKYFEAHIHPLYDTKHSVIDNVIQKDAEGSTHSSYEMTSKLYKCQETFTFIFRNFPDNRLVTLCPN